uniref:Uncharacterized protein n=1 Tax=Rhizophora mucronata TaxID=61149 RepID=A0A2P2PBX1_RHIMU
MVCSFDLIWQTILFFPSKSCSCN